MSQKEIHQNPAKRLLGFLCIFTLAASTCIYAFWGGLSFLIEHIKKPILSNLTAFSISTVLFWASITVGWIAIQSVRQYVLNEPPKVNKKIQNLHSYISAFVFLFFFISLFFFD